MAKAARYELYYWPEIQGRGEFVRLALEDAGADYVDVAREKDGLRAMLRLLRGDGASPAPFAPPFLRSGKRVIAQTAEILHYLGPRVSLVPARKSARWAALQHQLTIADLVQEVHDTHHPVGAMLYYEDQKREARRRAEQFLSARAPKFLGYFERELARGGKRQSWILGRSCSYVDLSLFQVLEGIRYAFPNGARKLERKLPHLRALSERVRERPRIAAYLASPRRIPFNEQGIFRHYPELDAPESRERRLRSKKSPRSRKASS